ncbi:hypothetical protein DNH61_05735 [Paenibacillus sambharensis]|uniref:Uncharacterized protein n=1 Tax=Paenibacillus sambharensis TaxID=1803190 RepID=A0A2W1LYE1_9BACL|nr:hypothetical protein DNH61_05735 [Paenibacillus sambharensis]
MGQKDMATVGRWNVFPVRPFALSGLGTQGKCEQPPHQHNGTCATRALTLELWNCGAVEAKRNNSKPSEL